MRCVFAIVILTSPLFKRASLYSEVLPHCNEVIPNSFIRLSVLLVTSFINAVVQRFCTLSIGNDSNLLIVFYVQIMPDDFVMQFHRF